MPVYVYRAATKRGIIVRNKVEETSKNNLYLKLKRSGLTPIEINQTSLASKKKVTKKKNISNIDEIMKNANTTDLDRPKAKKMTTTEKINSYLGTTEKVTTRDIVVFTQDFYLLKKANFNNIHALSTIIDSTENMTLRGVLEDILAGVEAGDYMYTTMEYYSDIFPYIYINMIKVGELSGSLTNSLKQAADYLDDTEALNKKLRSILIPNLIQFIGLLILLLVGTLVAIPQIQNVFDELGTTETLPAVTLWFQGVIDGIIEYWYIPTFIITAAIIAVVAYVHTPKGKYNFHYFKYTMPIFGSLIYSIDFSRLLKAMHLNLQNGMRIQDSLEVSKNVISNYVLLSIIETSINNMITGDSWIDPFEKAGLGSPMTIEMLRIGMQTDLTEMMEKLTEYMEIDINQKLERIMKVLPQVVYIIVGLVLIFFVVVVLVPCIQVYMGNFLFSAYGV
jgi:type II secretory pathway component PulF